MVYNLDKINELLHYMKGVEPFSRILSDLTEGSKRWCPFQHDDGFSQDCYTSNPAVQEMIHWTDKYLVCCKFLDIDRYSLGRMTASLQTVRTPERIAGHDDFETLVASLQGDIEFVEASLGEKLSRLECTECARLDESLVCFQNYCFYAAVVMAVSAVEFRIAAMIRRSDPELFRRHFQGATLGQLVAVFQGDAYKGEEFLEIKKLMPERHNALVALLNNYRVFAAHPTERKVTGQIAEAILHLAFSFLMDPETCPYTAEEMACGS